MLQQKESRREDVATKNDAFKERFQFILSSNGNIICQRYFRINGYNNDSLGTVDLYQALEECVDMIKEDLNYKSFVYQTLINDEPIKLTGFVNEPASFSDLCNIASSMVEGEITLSDGTTIEKEYMHYSSKADDIYGDSEELNPWDVTFKFEFRVDDRPVFERIWDGTVYPKHIRNSVDLSNTGSNNDPKSVFVNSIDGVLSYTKLGRPNLVYLIIRKIISVMSGGFDKQDRYTNTITIGDKEYEYYAYDKKFNDGWKEYTKAKADKYFQWITRCEKYSDMGGLFPNEWNRIEKYM
jgi:hypothetical protein